MPEARENTTGILLAFDPCQGIKKGVFYVIKSNCRNPLSFYCQQIQ